VIAGSTGGDLEANWARDDGGVAHRSAWPVYGAHGADAAVTYFEIDPGMRIGAHRHDASETILVIEGAARASVGDEERSVTAGAIVHVPEGARHDVANESNEVLRLVGYFPRPEVVTVFEDVQMPDDTKELGTPG
jgi:quercetin dioxygenase-like cupin family protein